jgi:C-terminal processing protease CtpA/Prc
VPGSRFGANKPVYILTSHQTISGGEELAYDFQSLRRAKVIGEATAGAANPAHIHFLKLVRRYRA